MKIYFLTKKNNETNDGKMWGENITHTASGEGDLYDSGFIKAYKNPYYAILFNYRYDGYKENICLWECEGKIKKEDELRVGCIELTTIKKINIPKISIKQRIYFSYLFIKNILNRFEQKYSKVEKLKNDLKFAEEYLDGKIINKKNMFRTIFNLYYDINYEKMNPEYEMTGEKIDINEADIIGIVFDILNSIYNLITNENENNINFYATIRTSIVIYGINNINESILNENIKKMIQFKE